MAAYKKIRKKGKIENNEVSIELWLPEVKRYADCGKIVLHAKTETWCWVPPGDVAMFGQYVTRAIWQELERMNYKPPQKTPRYEIKRKNA